MYKRAATCFRFDSFGDFCCQVVRLANCYARPLGCSGYVGERRVSSSTVSAAPQLKVLSMRPPARVSLRPRCSTMSLNTTVRRRRKYHLVGLYRHIMRGSIGPKHGRICRSAIAFIPTTFLTVQWILFSFSALKMRKESIEL